MNNDYFVFMARTEIKKSYLLIYNKYNTYFSTHFDILKFKIDIIISF